MRTCMAVALGLSALAGCNPDPSDELEQTIGYRTGLEPGEPNSGERGNIQITEVLWSGTVRNNGGWDSTDVFVEIKNEGARPVNLTGWHLEMDGTRVQTFRLPASDFELEVGSFAVVAAKADGCLVDPQWVVPELSFSYGDPFRLTLRDFDERLIDSAGSREAAPFAGAYDGAVSRSMEKVALMFGGRGTEPHSWHYYNRAPVDVPNNTNLAPECRRRTGASPGLPNSPDYSGAFSTGNFE